MDNLFNKAECLKSVSELMNKIDTQDMIELMVYVGKLHLIYDKKLEQQPMSLSTIQGSFLIPNSDGSYTDRMGNRYTVKQ